MSSLFFQVVEHTIPCQHIRHYPHATLGDQEDVLQLAVKQYTPLDNLEPSSADVTIIGAHANGFPKELYEPLWDEILLRSKNAGFTIRAIWIADMAHQGASGVLNERKLGKDPSWFDHTRDMLHMVNHFRSQISRPIIGIGHSAGAAQLAALSLIHPRLLEGLVMIDPVIQRETSERGNFQPAIASSRRRDRWPSRDAAVASLKRSPFFNSWDPRVRERFARFGFRELPTALFDEGHMEQGFAEETPTDDSATEREVTLTTTKHQEVFTFLRPNFSNTSPTAMESSDPDPLTHNRRTHPDINLKAHPHRPFYRPEPTQIFVQMPYLRPGVLYIFGGKSSLSTPELRQQMLNVTGTGVGGNGGLKANRVVEAMVREAGHLVPMERVAETAEHSVAWIGKEMQRWRLWEEADRKEWDDTPVRERNRISEEAVKMLGAGGGKARTRSEKL